MAASGVVELAMFLGLLGWGQKKEKEAPGPMPTDIPADAAPAPARNGKKDGSGAAPPGTSTATVAPALDVTALPSIPWPTAVPASLPPFPGPGWEPDAPVTPETSQRAEYWNAKLWDFPSKTIRKPSVTENFGGQWTTFSAAWHPGDKGPKTFMATEAWRVKPGGVPAAAPAQAPASAAPSAAAPAQAAASPASAPAAAPAGAPPRARAAPAAAPPPTNAAPFPAAPVSPYPGPGSWGTNAQYIARYQTALAQLGFNPGALDGKYGPATAAAVKAFQTAHGLTADGQAGPATAAAIDQALGAGAPGASP
jgi:Putative peptidoglycan binding domain